MSTQAIIIALTFVGILLIVEGIYLLVFGNSIRAGSRINRRLALLEEGGDHETVLETLRREREQHRFGVNFPILSLLSKKATQANIAFSPSALIFVMIFVSIFAGTMLFFMTAAEIPVSVVGGLVLGFGGVFAWLSYKAKQRMAMFEEQLPDAVDLIVRSLRVGHPFNNAINVVAEELADPIGSEFGLVADETTYGMDISTALDGMAERIDVPDLRFFAVAVAIQSRSGGNLAEVLDGLSKVIRSRFKLFRRVSAITAEAKWSGWFLSGFPLFALFIVNVMNPGYYDNVRPTPYFLPACIFVAVMLSVNIIVMRSMVNIKV
jgi:tight adherence protein B